MSEAFIIIVSGILALALASIAAYELGIRRGRAIGWIEHYESCVARDRSRRQRNGQFKAKEAKAL